MKVNINSTSWTTGGLVGRVKCGKKKILFQINKLQGTFWVQYLNKSLLSPSDYERHNCTEIRGSISIAFPSAIGNENDCCMNN
jgi:hypothetical protein